MKGPKAMDMPISREDPRYQTLIRGFNLRWVGNPRFVQVVEDAQQVRETVQSAVSLKMRLTVRSGGHCYEDFVCANDDGVIIDLSGLDGIYEENGMIVVESGCTLWDLYSQMYKKWGLTIPGGSCYSVGVGGHVCGGGYGLLSRLHGLTVDYLAGVEVVVVDRNGQAQIVRARKDDFEPEKRNLFWAHTGGGGGNFGIVTKYFFQELPQAPQEAWLAHMAWNWSDLDEGKFSTLVRKYGDFFAEHSGVDSQYKGLFALLHLTHVSAKQIRLTAQYVGDQPELLQDFIRQMQTHSAQTQMRRLPWLIATQNLDASGPNQRGKYKSAYMRQPFRSYQLPVMFKWLTDESYSNEQALLQVDSYGGQVNAINKDATAVIHRDSILKVQYQTYWTEKEEDPYHLKWIRGFYNEMYGEDGPLGDEHVDGCFINYPDVDLKQWQTLYYGSNYPRLQQVKQQWDPLNIFHHQQSIELP
ncbi:MAG: FAD-binding oxidoreductase [Ardenticatenaceae bacterium]